MKLSDKNIRALYFIQEGTDGPIKIGISNSPKSRLREMQTGNPRSLSIVKVVYGCPTVFEGMTHRKFSDCNIKGEWYEPTPCLLSFIACLTDSKSVEKSFQSPFTK